MGNRKSRPAAAGKEARPPPPERISGLMELAYLYEQHHKHPTMVGEDIFGSPSLRPGQKISKLLEAHEKQKPKKDGVFYYVGHAIKTIPDKKDFFRLPILAIGHDIDQESVFLARIQLKKPIILGLKVDVSQEVYDFAADLGVKILISKRNSQVLRLRFADWCVTNRVNI